MNGSPTPSAPKIYVVDAGGTISSVGEEFDCARHLGPSGGDYYHISGDPNIIAFVVDSSHLPSGDPPMPNNPAFAQRRQQADGRAEEDFGILTDVRGPVAFAAADEEGRAMCMDAATRAVGAVDGVPLIAAGDAPSMFLELLPAIMAADARARKDFQQSLEDAGCTVVRI